MQDKVNKPFVEKLRELIVEYGKDHECGTHSYIIAEHMERCLDSYEKVTIELKGGVSEMLHYQDKVNDIIDERGKEYGDIRKHFGHVGASWHNHLRGRGIITVHGKDSIKSHDVAIMMTLFKIARIAHKATADSFLDSKAYLEIAERLSGVIEDEKEPEIIFDDIQGESFSALEKAKKLVEYFRSTAVNQEELIHVRAIIKSLGGLEKELEDRFDVESDKTVPHSIKKAQECTNPNCNCKKPGAIFKVENVEETEKGGTHRPPNDSLT
jgi:hypothetical protein